MTLFFRLAALALAGLVIAALTYFLLWPSSTRTSDMQVSKAAASQFSVVRLAGQYSAKNKTGAYRLNLTEDGKAKLDFTDKKGKHFAYQGEIVEGKIIWRQSLTSKKWIDLARPVEDAYTIESPSTVVTGEGRFNRA